MITFILGASFGALCMYSLCHLRLSQLATALRLANEQRRNMAKAAEGASNVLKEMTTVLQNNIDGRKAKLAEERLMMGHDSPSIN